MATFPTAAVQRIQDANGNAYDATSNPGGLAQGGHRQNFVPDLQAVVAVATYAGDSATEVASKAAEFQAAVDAIEAGPVSSVNGRSGAVTGLAELSGATFTGAVAAPTAAFGDNDTSVATTAFVQAAYPKASAAVRRAFTSTTAVNTPASDATAMAIAVNSSISGTFVLNINFGFNQAITLTGNATASTVSAAFDGLPVVFYFIQDATGGRTLAFNATYHKFPGGIVPTLSTAANAVDRLSGMCRNRGGTIVIEWSGLDKDIK